MMFFLFLVSLFLSLPLSFHIQCRANSFFCYVFSSFLLEFTSNRVCRCSRATLSQHNDVMTRVFRLWAEVFHVNSSGAGTVKWQQVSEDLVPVNITCIQDSPECVFHITAYNSQVDKILDVRLVQPGEAIIATYLATLKPIAGGPFLRKTLKHKTLCALFYREHRMHEGASLKRKKIYIFLL